MTDLNVLRWTEEYLKYKDTVQRRIQNIKRINEQEILCELKNGEQKIYLCLDSLENTKIEDIKNKNVSCLNTKKNLDWLINNWNELKKENTTFFFANPKKAMHWSINPKIHDGVADKTATKTGLKALFDATPEV